MAPQIFDDLTRIQAGQSRLPRPAQVGRAIALAEHGIRVNAIGPGTILTELARAVVLADEASRQRTLSRIALRRCGEPEEVAAVASFLPSDDAS